MKAVTHRARLALSGRLLLLGALVAAAGAAVAMAVVGSAGRGDEAPFADAGSRRQRRPEPAAQPAEAVIAGEAHAPEPEGPAPAQVPERPARRRMLGGAHAAPIVLIGAVAVAAALGFAFIFGGSGDHEVTARFADANGLVKGNDVRVAGINAGTITAVSIATDPQTGHAVATVTMNIDGAHWPLHQGTRLAVRPTGVLGNPYVAVQPGSATAGTIERSHVFGTDETDSPVQLDEFNNIFNPDVRTSIRTQIQEGMVVFGGSGADTFNSFVQRLNPLTADLEPITATLAARSPELSRLNSEFDTITRELASEDANLRGLIENGNTFLGALAAREHQLQGTLDHAAGTLTSLDRGLSGEEGNLRSFFQKGPTSLDKTRAAADLTTPLLLHLDPHIPSLDVLLQEFTTANGFVNTTPNGRNVDTLRIDVKLTNPPGRTAVPCGGEPSEQHNTCPSSTPNVSWSGGSTGSPTLASDNGTAAVDGQSDVWAQFGSIFQ